jgi:membrane-associated phospholipid phosphatase
MLPSVLASHCVLAVAALLAAAPAPSDVRPPADQAPGLHELHFDATRAGLVAGVGAALLLGSEALFKENLAPATCRWCDRAPDGTDRLNRLDRWGRGLAGSTEESRKRANLWSNLMDFGVLPLGVLGTQYALSRNSGAPRRMFFQDSAIIVESAVLALAFNQGVKFIAGRQRPFVYLLPEDQKPLTPHPTDNNVSFASSHTAVAFSLVVSAGTVAQLRGYNHRGWIWAVGLPLATSVGLMRMAADKHYLTDVAVGAAMGAAFGVAVPLLLHGRASARADALALHVTGGPRGAVVTGHF